MSQLIYIKVDGVQFGRVKLAHSSTITQLRIMLDKHYRFPPNTHFLDIKGYPVAREDEQIDTIKQLLHAEDIVLMRTDELMVVLKSHTDTSNLKRRREEIITEGTTFITTEVFSILGWLWRLVLKPIIILTLILFLLYYGYTKLVCSYGHSLPLITMYCLPPQPKILPVPPFGDQAQNSASLSNVLANADVSAPMHCVQAKIAVIELRAQIIHSDIDKDVRESLSEQMLELQKLTETGADQLTTMIASFSGAIDKLNIYTDFLQKDLSKINNLDMHHGRQLQIGYSEAEVTDKLTELFDEYTKGINEQVDKILFKAEGAHMSLELISNKFETILDLNYKGKHISQSRLDQLQHGSYWFHLFDEGELGIVKHQRNIKTLDAFSGFISNTSENIIDIIGKLKSYKIGATDLKETTAALDSSRRKSIERELEIIKTALERLTQSKQTFEKKIEQKSRENQSI